MMLSGVALTWRCVQHLIGLCRLYHLQGAFADMSTWLRYPLVEHGLFPACMFHVVFTTAAGSRRLSVRDVLRAVTVPS